MYKNFARDDNALRIKRRYKFNGSRNVALDIRRRTRLLTLLRYKIDFERGRGDRRVSTILCQPTATYSGSLD